ncbi:MAG: RibD family protein [Chitinophagales bacterium]
MRPKVIMHTQITLDGNVRGFDDTPIYYIVASRLNADMALIGSETVYTAAEQYPPETEKDFVKPADDPNDTRMLCVVPDSRGRLRNLHVFRDSEYCKDLILIVSTATPQTYLDYLEERDYDYIVTGNDHVDYAKALEVLYEMYNCRIIRTDSGGVLTNVLIEQGLVDEISLIISPCLVGTGPFGAFRTLSLPDKVELELISTEVVADNYLWLLYKVIK